MAGGYPYTDTTELLVPGSGSWRLAGLLPRPLSGVRVATAANTLYMLGGQIVSSWRPCTNLRVQGGRTAAMSIMPRSWLAACCSRGTTTPQPPYTSRMSGMFAFNKLIFFKQICRSTTLSVRSF